MVSDPASWAWMLVAFAARGIHLDGPERRSPPTVVGGMPRPSVC